jgi:hypothetical protein
MPVRIDSSQWGRSVAVAAAAMLLLPACVSERVSGGEPVAPEAPDPVPGMPGFAMHHQRAAREVIASGGADVVVARVLYRSVSDSWGRGRFLVEVEADCATLGLRRGRRADLFYAADREQELFAIDAGFEAVAVGDRRRFLVERKWMKLLVRLVGESVDAGSASAR